MSTPEVQRVAVRVLGLDGEVLGAGWLRHGDTPLDALSRLLGQVGAVVEAAGAGGTAAPRSTVDLAASMPLRAARSMPREVGGLRLHLLTLDYALPAGVRLDGGHDETVDPAHLGEVLTSWSDGGRADPLGGQLGRDPMKVQRAGAYALVHADGRVLLTRLAHSGRWTLPGGGIDAGEQPEASLVREVYEETGLEPGDVRLVEVTTARWTGRAPDGIAEDFQAVQLLYTATVANHVEPRVVEVGGSTSEAAWVEVARIADLPSTFIARAGLRRVGVRFPE